MFVSLHLCMYVHTYIRMQISQEYIAAELAFPRIRKLTCMLRSPIAGCISSTESAFCCKFPYHLATLRSTSDLTSRTITRTMTRTSTTTTRMKMLARTASSHHHSTFRCAIAIFRSAPCRSRGTRSCCPTTRVTVRPLRKLQLLLC